MRKILAAIAAAFMVASPASAGDVKINTSPVVQVRCEGSLGSAVKISGKGYITAGHVAEAEGCTVAGQPIQNVRMYPGDFATFDGPSSPVKAKTTCSDFKPDEEYLAVGYGLGMPVLMYQPVRASAFKKPSEPFQMFTGEVIPGMSGGALYDKSGKVVGIVNMRWPARSLPLTETPLCGK